MDNFYQDSNRFEVTELTLTSVMARVFLIMGIGLTITGFTAWTVGTNDFLINSLYSNPALLIGLMIAELVVVLAFSAMVNKVSHVAGMIMFVVYSLLNGVTLSFIFLMYVEASIYSTFLITAVTFFGMAVFGYTTKKSLHGIGSYLMMGLMGIIIAGIVNIFFQNDMLSFIISVIGVVVFVGLTAYDTQRIKERLNAASSDEEVKRVSVYGALILYLDFVNLFLKLLRLLGKRR